MNTTEKENFLKGLKIMHKAMCLGPAILMVLFNFLLINKSSDLGTAPGPIGIFILVISAFVLMGSIFLFKKNTKQINGILSEDNKERWREAYILKWALLEGAALINILIYYFAEPNPILLIVALLLLLYLFISGPKFS